MYNPYNHEANTSIENFLIPFKKYLLAEKVASITQRAYLSDTRFFLKWLYSFLKTNHHSEANSDVPSVIGLVNEKILFAYKDYLQSSSVPAKSVNRKFSALRKLGTFCVLQNLRTENIFESLKNISKQLPFPEVEYHLNEFKNELFKQGNSKITVKNYLSDIKHFLIWKAQTKV